MCVRKESVGQILSDSRHQRRAFPHVPRSSAATHFILVVQADSLAGLHRGLVAVFTHTPSPAPLSTAASCV